MSSSVILTSQNEKNVVNCIRWLTRKKEKDRNFNFTKNDIASILNIQWATVSNIISCLKDNGIVEDSKDKICLKSNIECFVGISLGSSRIKFTCLDFNFQPLKLDCVNQDIKSIITNNLKKYNSCLDLEEEFAKHTERDGIIKNVTATKSVADVANMEYCFNINLKNKSDEDKQQFSTFEILNDLCQLIIDLKKNDYINIGSVGFAFPGIIDYSAKKIKSSHMFRNISNIDLKDLIDESVYNEFISLFRNRDSEKVNYIFDEHSNSACVAEKELGNVAQALQNKSNLTVIYGGYGYGVGLVLDNKLFRNSNAQYIGQFGHIQVKKYSQYLNTNDYLYDSDLIDSSNNLSNEINIPCRCGLSDCLENRINVDVFGRGIDYKNEDIFKSLPLETLCEILRHSAYKRYVLSYYLSQAIHTISQFIGAENIVLTGKLSKYYNIIQNELKNMLLTTFAVNPQNVKASDLGEFVAVKGIAIESYYYKYDMSLEWK